MLTVRFQVINYLLGSLSRIFTTLQEVPDKLILGGFVAGFILNAVLASQLVYYWNAPTSRKTESKKLKNKPITAEKVNAGEQKSFASTVKSPSTRRRG
jgi:mannose-P-dolichol utilization defect protein 1